MLEAARRTPRFLKQMAQNALTHGAPLNWLGGIDVDDRGTIDLKLQGTAIFVDAARLYSLAHGSALTSHARAAGKRGRADGAGRRPNTRPGSGGFEFLQMLRLRVQLEDAPPADASQPDRGGQR